jgi:hypothetical protein
MVKYTGGKIGFASTYVIIFDYTVIGIDYTPAAPSGRLRHDLSIWASS